MKLTLLGTSAGEGYPGFWCECPNCAAARRMGGKNVRGNGCSMLDEDVLIDMNEHFFEMTPRMDIHPARIDTLLVTHPHRDHFTPMLLSQRAMPAECVGMTIEQLQAYISPSFTLLPMLHVYGNRFVEEAIRAVPGLMESAERCRFTFHRLEAGTEMQIKENLSVLPIASIHTETPGFAYNYIIRRDGKTLLYASDTGGYTPDMYNYSQETDVYKIWADMVCFDKNTKPIGAHHFCAFYGRRDGTHYKLDDYEIMMKYRDHMVMNGRIPDALSGAMANQMYVATFDTQEELDQFYSDMEEKF